MVRVSGFAVQGRFTIEHTAANCGSGNEIAALAAMEIRIYLKCGTEAA